MARTIAKDHDEKRLHILKVAAQVFAREGIARSSMSAVASACGISKANIYHYYPSKDDLIFGILDSYLSELRDRVCGLDLARLEPAGRLSAVTREVLLAYEGMDHEHKIQTEGLPLLSTEKQAVLKGHQKDLVRLMAGVLADCAPDALKSEPSKARDVTMSVFGMLNWFYMWQSDATPEERLRYADLVTHITLHGIENV